MPGSGDAADVALLILGLLDLPLSGCESSL